VVVGIGLNVNWPDEPPAELSGVAVAANHVAGRNVDRERLLAQLLEGLAKRYSSLASVAEDYRRRCATIGRDVQVELPGKTLRGRAVDVDDAGHLVVDTGSGLRVVAVGDVVHLR
jgi:BirA family biotin operon repressor/biotin-[acetyl-CoA-carboxylase] ligase